MRVRRTGTFNISKNLSILRAFVDAIKIKNGNIYLSVAYRRGRAFCRYDANLRLMFRVEEKTLAENGFGDYRAFTVDNSGRMIIAGSARDGAASIFTFDGSGRISDKKFIKNFPLIESIAVDDSGNIFLHSPLSNFPVVRFEDNFSRPVGIGKYPFDGGIDSRIAQIDFDGEGNLIVAYSNHPPSFQIYDPSGNSVFQKRWREPGPSPDLLMGILDFTIDYEKNLIYFLRNSGPGIQRSVEIYDNKGGFKDSLNLSPLVRRIGAGPGGVIYSSETHFGVLKMLLSLKLYGAMTLINVEKIEEQNDKR